MLACWLVAVNTIMGCQYEYCAVVCIKNFETIKECIKFCWKPSVEYVRILLKLLLNVLQAAASCYIELVVKESDNNVKLIVLDRLVALKEVPAHEKVLQVKSQHDIVIYIAFYELQKSINLY